MNETDSDNGSPNPRRFCHIDDEVILNLREESEERKKTETGVSKSLAHPFGAFSPVTERCVRIRRQSQDIKAKSPQIFRCINAIQLRLGRR
ncbi:hypothetical protein Thimo_0292 [Thioflavicoccus mobilis 8321]|uniref:Uncharacterized protein n=1 Tax=Thioflavicoccus mobilis 8321 TaxID=765912 RepID=L0GTM6_9GAMM|nr:hypothetical protein [Thioflavicoccus mobilis]AGA89162.1 hypothetical protein Thimo_0292 [Thioflavicoccus mobilis 8321]